MLILSLRTRRRPCPPPRAPSSAAATAGRAPAAPTASAAPAAPRSIDLLEMATTNPSVGFGWNFWRSECVLASKPFVRPQSGFSTTRGRTLGRAIRTGCPPGHRTDEIAGSVGAPWDNGIGGRRPTVDVESGAEAHGHGVEGGSRPGAGSRAVERVSEGTSGAAEPERASRRPSQRVSGRPSRKDLAAAVPKGPAAPEPKGPRGRRPERPRGARAGR